MKKILSCFLIILLLTSCKSYEMTNNTYDGNREIVILYTNVLSSSVKSDEFYDIVKDSKIDCLKETPNVTLVDLGNILDQNNGSYNSSIDSMNSAQYDFAILGENDFSNGLTYLSSGIEKASFKYLMCNVSYNGTKRDIFKKTSPFMVVDYDGIKVGYIGVEDPSFIEKMPNKFLEGDSTVVNFYNETEEVFYDTVQCSIDKAKDLGAEYIVVLSNLKTNINNDENENYYLEDLISSISSVDIVINGNTMNNGAEERMLNDLDNKDVFAVLNGLDGTAIGKVVISNNSITNLAIK